MARIRSIHPGLFTDENFVVLSDAAQIFLVGLWTEADDQGVFEWKPVTLKMRIRPAAITPVEPLLEELKAANWVANYEMDGHQFGALRNFRKFQRPKSPNAVHPLHPDFRNYVGLSPPISEIGPVDAPPIPPNGEIAPQMEGRMEDVGKGEDGQGSRSTAESATLAWSGRVIRLRQPDFDKWQASYGNIPDFPAALQAADDYYAEHPPKGGKWFFAVSNWLKRENEHAKQATAANGRDDTW